MKNAVLSSMKEMPTFGTWEAEILEHAYEHIDYLSLHSYYGNKENDTESYLTRNLDMDDFIKTVTSICDSAKSKKGSSKRIDLSFDEWNVWYHSLESDREIPRWGVAPSRLDKGQMEGETYHTVIPKASWNVLRF